MPDSKRAGTSDQLPGSAKTRTSTNAVEEDPFSNETINAQIVTDVLRIQSALVECVESDSNRISWRNSNQMHVQRSSHLLFALFTERKQVLIDLQVADPMDEEVLRQLASSRR